MSKSTILELRQKDSKRVNLNGDYETTFNSGVVDIQEGDIVTLKSAYIDTTFQNQFNFDNDQLLNIEFCPYITDWSRGQDKTGWQNNVADDNPDFVTGAIYSPYKKIVAGNLNPEVYQLVTEINYWLSSLSAPNPDSVTFTFNYLDYNDTPRQLIKTYPPGYFSNGSYGDKIVTDKTTAVLIRAGSFKPTSDTLNREFENAELDPNKGYFFLTFGEPTADLYEPYLLNAQIVIPKGSYTPEELGQILTEKMASNRSTNNPGIFNNPFVFPVNVFDVGKPDPEQPSENIQEEVYYYNQTGYNKLDPIPDGESTGDALTNRFYFQPNSSTLIGSSQISFQYDGISKFQILYLHTPIYDDLTGATISCRYLRQGSNFGEEERRGNIYTCARHSGIFFTSLTSIDAVTLKPTRFWENLGFDLGSLCPQKISTQILEEKFGEEGIWSYYNLIDGINVTNGYVGLDSAIKKTKNDWFSVVDVPNDDDVGFESTIQATTIINASLTLPQVFNPYSHFLISCDLNYTSDYIGGDSMWTKISSIVSKYYSYGTYTSGDGSASIQYTHTGAPIYLKNARIRILTPDKTIDPELGPDNTIMMEIIKPITQQQPQEQEKKK
jgi:hypothetical protein